MAWSDAARQAALESRRAHAKAKGTGKVQLTTMPNVKVTRGQMAHGLRVARKFIREGNAGPGGMLSKAVKGMSAAGKSVATQHYAEQFANAARKRARVRRR